MGVIPGLELSLSLQDNKKAIFVTVEGNPLSNLAQHWDLGLNSIEALILGHVAYS